MADDAMTRTDLLSLHPPFLLLFFVSFESFVSLWYSLGFPSVFASQAFADFTACRHCGRFLWPLPGAFSLDFSPLPCHNGPFLKTIRLSVRMIISAVGELQ
ncbi:MAG TPA: hypothetical protein VM223_17985 [Planctomycetota bacterium]|nr:hypothetical protein [Planctomycetota bacterium]